MPNLNKVMLMGRLTRDPELRHTPQGTPVSEIGLAVNRVWFDQDRNKQEDTTFVDVVAWNRQAETIKNYLKKGSPLFVEGRLQLSTWETKDGEKRSKLRVRLESFQFIDSGGARASFDDGSGGRQAPPPAPYPSQPAQASEEWGSYSSGPQAGPSAPVRDDLGLSNEEPEVPF